MVAGSAAAMAAKAAAVAKIERRILGGRSRELFSCEVGMSRDEWLLIPKCSFDFGTPISKQASRSRSNHCTSTHHAVAARCA